MKTLEVQYCELYRREVMFVTHATLPQPESSSCNWYDALISGNPLDYVIVSLEND